MSKLTRLSTETRPKDLRWLTVLRIVCWLVLLAAIYFAYDHYRSFEDITSMDQLLPISGRVDSIATMTDGWAIDRRIREHRRSAVRLVGGPIWYVTATNRGSFSPHYALQRNDSVTLYVKLTPQKADRNEADLFAGVIHDRASYPVTFLHFDEVIKGYGPTIFKNPFWLLMVLMPLGGLYFARWFRTH